MSKKETNNIMKFFGVLKNFDWDKKEKSIEQLRNNVNKKLNFDKLNSQK